MPGRRFSPHRQISDADRSKLEELVRSNREKLDLALVGNRVILTFYIPSIVVAEDSFQQYPEHQIAITFPTNYPFEPPRLRFADPVLFHPNVPTTGAIPIDDWTTNTDLDDVVEFLWKLLTFQHVDLEERPLSNPNAAQAVRQGYIRLPLSKETLQRPQRQLHYQEKYSDRQSTPAQPRKSTFKIKGRRTYIPPDRDSVWQAPDLSGYQISYRHSEDAKDARQNRVKVVLRQSVFDKISAHAVTDTERELFGILVGNAFSDANSNRYWVEVVDMFPAKKTRSSRAHVEVDPEELSRLDEEVAKQDLGENVRRLGWYHTHPGHFIFMSGTDMENQRKCYNADWQIALVIDPINKVFGIFSGSPPIAIQDVQIVPDRPAALAWAHWEEGIPVSNATRVTDGGLSSDPRPLPENKPVPNAWPTSSSIPTQNGMRMPIQSLLKHPVVLILALLGFGIGVLAHLLWTQNTSMQIAQDKLIQEAESLEAEGRLAEAAELYMAIINLDASTEEGQTARNSLSAIASVRELTPTSTRPPTSTPFSIAILSPTPQPEGPIIDSQPTTTSTLQPTATSTVSCDTRENEYVVQLDDDLRTIAEAFSVSPDELRRANPKLAYREYEEPGITICIPLAPTPTLLPSLRPSSTPDFVRYVVQEADTIASIAREFGVTIEDIQAVNPELTNVNRIRVGQEIVVPQ